MYNKIKNFITKADGAITVDWVVLCAAVLFFALTIVAATRDGTVDLADRTIVMKSNGS
ncbi:hypothetical protein [Sulfitobacter sp. CW3]|jgi:hypothetical protein|uniref:hypothetical protein n=1 Tax=unclassified Sulfitobacter TaxID=196795 RepID=UPI001C606975|nr:hypothetical protein [Sulfitobacter sp. CW3]MBW4961181.1 hypothetical protein [Sulfitobacter sp. CW3]